MSAAPPGSLSRAERMRWAVALAGELAEASVRVLTLTQPGQTPQTLHTRQTDLPGLLAGCPPGTALLAGDRSIIVPWTEQPSD
ncbi:MAG: hypothetical protein LW650_02740 [Planctomycetaceae bacterium]|nr:hypothetical protein [Phycisphaerales bacterium]MCE2652441.1 hypothetical protein [Planctomycetaceae bacterium]